MQSVQLLRLTADQFPLAILMPRSPRRSDIPPIWGSQTLRTDVRVLRLFMVSFFGSSLRMECCRLSINDCQAELSKLIVCAIGPMV